MRKKNIITILLTFLIVGMLILTACGGEEELAHEANSLEMTYDLGTITDEVIVTVERKGDHPVYNSIEALSQKASDVIRGEVLDERVELRNTVLPFEVIVEEIRNQFTEEEILYFFGEDLN